MPTTVGDLSNLLDVSPQTIRKWCDVFAEKLSPTATPPSGEVRIFTDSDIQVLVLVAQMRQALASYEDIKQALEQGERGEIPTIEQGEADTGTALVIRYQAEIEVRERRIGELEQDRAGWERRYEEERAARIEAERRAASAETEARLLREANSLREQQSTPATSEQDQEGRRPWWKRLFR